MYLEFENHGSSSMAWKMTWSTVWRGKALKVLQPFLGIGGRTVGDAEAIKNAGEKGSDENQLIFFLWSNYIGLDSGKARSLMRTITAQKMAWYPEMSKWISNRRGVRQDQERYASNSHTQLMISLNPELEGFGQKHQDHIENTSTYYLQLIAYVFMLK